MNYRKLGTSNVLISEIGMGCMSLDPADKNSISIIHNAIDLGINFFDTADLYNKGQNEELVGTALTGKREKVILATKVGNRWKSDGSGWDWVPKKDYILSAAEQSLKRLKTDYIDLYQLHGGTIEDNFDEVFEAFEILKNAGKVRFFGLSSIRPNVIKKVIEQHAISTLMVQYSLLDRRPEEFFKLIAENKVGVVARGVLAGGLLVDKPAKQYLDYQESEIQEFGEELNRFKKFSDDCSIAIGYVLSEPAVTSAVLGFRTRQQLNNVFKYLNHLPIQENIVGELRQLLPAKLYTQHR